MSFTVYIGWDPREVLAYEVCRQSLVERAWRPIDVRPLMLDECIARGLYTRPVERRGGTLWDPVSGAPMATEFALTRFLVPHLVGHTGWALFCDADFLWRADVSDLLALRDDRYAIMCVPHDHQPVDGTKMDGQIQTRYARKNWSSLMLIQCGHPAVRALGLEEFNRTPGRDLHRFSWMPDAVLGTLPVAWNWLEGVSSPEIDPKAVHYTNGGPWLPIYADCAYADDWRAVQARLAATAKA